MNYWIITFFSLALLLLPGFSSAHWENPQGCKNVIKALSQMELEQSYEGVSEDRRDYIIRWKSAKGPVIVEEHHILLPPTQWKEKDKPEPFDPVLSLWVDWDGNGTYGEFYLFPRGVASCSDALHFIWDDTLQTYKLYAMGKERT